MLSIRCWQVFGMGLRSSSLNVAMIDMILRSTPVHSVSVTLIIAPWREEYQRPTQKPLSSLLTAHSVRQRIWDQITISFWGSLIISCILCLFLSLIMVISILWLVVHFPCLPIALCCCPFPLFTHCIVLLLTKCKVYLSISPVYPLNCVVVN